MVIDTSAVIAILQDEPERLDLVRALERDPIRFMSAVSVVETSMVVESRYGGDGVRELDLFMEEAEIEVSAFDRRQAGFAREAFRLYGKGRHRAGLNFGDCCTYALARSVGQPILHTGDDFIHTDIGVVR